MISINSTHFQRYMLILQLLLLKGAYAGTLLRKRSDTSASLANASVAGIPYVVLIIIAAVGLLAICLIGGFYAYKAHIAYQKYQSIRKKVYTEEENDDAEKDKQDKPPSSVAGVVSSNSKFTSPPSISNNIATAAEKQPSPPPNRELKDDHVEDNNNNAILKPSQMSMNSNKKVTFRGGDDV